MQTAPTRHDAATDAADRQQVELVLRGQVWAFEPLVERHLNQVLGFLRYLGAPPAQLEDIAQETFVKAFERLNQFDRERSFFKWVLAIARNALFDEKRRFARERVRNEALAADPVLTVDVEELAVGRHTAQQVLSSLPDRDRFLVEAKLLKGLQFSEIAELTGDTENALMVRFHRILKRLRGGMKGDDHGHG